MAYTAVEVWSRLWTSTLVGRRTLGNTFSHFRDMKQRCLDSASKVLIATDSFHYNEEVIAATLGPTCVHVQVKKRYRKGRVVHTAEKLLIGSDDDFLEAMSRSEDSKTINTSYVERLNLTIRRSRSRVEGFHAYQLDLAEAEEKPLPIARPDAYG